MHLHALTQGILLGLTLSILIGPAFFSLIQTSLTKGLRAGIHFALGVSLSDIFMASVVWFGLSSLMERSSFREGFTIGGGIALILIGVYTVFSKRATPKAKERSININTFSFMKYTAKGFVANVANPGTWFYWIVPVGIASSYEVSSVQLTFLGGIFGVILLIDLLKCFIASELKRFMTERVINIVNRIVGIILMIFGVCLIFSLWVDFGITDSLPH
jgi:threonine/homoserine/homoserine lactone efflux protein